MLAQVAKISTEQAFNRLTLVYSSPLSSFAQPIGEFLTGIDMKKSSFSRKLCDRRRILYGMVREFQRTCG